MKKIVKKSVIETNEIPIVREVDVLVVGGGTSGSVAAIAAARNGKKTLLIERNSFIGGTATAGMMGQIGGPTRYAHGLGKEIIDRLLALDQAKTGPYTLFEPEGLKNVLMEMLDEAGAEVLLYTNFSSAIVENGQVKGVIFENKSGRQAVLANVVIDSSGDGDVCVDAGVPFWKGRERDGKMRPMTLIFEIGNLDSQMLVNYAQKNPDQFSPDNQYHVVDPENNFIRLTGFFDIIEKARLNGELDKNIYYMRFEDLDLKKRTTIVNTVRVYDVDGTKAEELSRAQFLARKQIVQLVAFIRKYVPGCKDAYLVNVAPNMGVRETRHIEGEYVLTEEDILSERVFPDNITIEYQRNVPRTEIHSPEPGEGARDDKRERVAIWQMIRYSVPYRSLLPKNISNMLVVGRCLSAAHQADGWTRSIPCCFSMGMAAGIAASISIDSGKAVKDIDIDTLQSELKRRGVRVNKFED